MAQPPSPSPNRNSAAPEAGVGMGLVGVLLEGYRVEEERRGRGLGANSSQPPPRMLGFSNQNEASGGVGAPGPLGAVWCFVGGVGWRPWRSDNPSCKIEGVWRKKGPKVPFCVECLRNLRCESANTTVVLEGATSSKRPRLPCVPEGPLFFRRGVLRRGEGAFKNKRKVCVFEGAPRGRAGARGSKIIFLMDLLSPSRIHEGK